MLEAHEAPGWPSWRLSALPLPSPWSSECALSVCHSWWPHPGSAAEDAQHGPCHPQQPETNITPLLVSDFTKEIIIRKDSI